MILLEKNTKILISRIVFDKMKKRFANRIKKKGNLKKGILFSFLSSKFIFKTNYLLSSSLILFKKKNCFNFSVCLLDWVHQFIKESYDFQENFFFFSSIFFFCKYFIEEFTLKNTLVHKKKLILKKLFSRFSKKYKKKNSFVNNNEKNWNFKIFFSDFKINIFFRKFLKNKKVEIFSIFKKKWIFFLKLILIKFFSNIFFLFNISSFSFLFNFSSFFVKFVYHIFIIKTWGNLHFDFADPIKKSLKNYKFKNNLEVSNQKEKKFFLIFQKINR